MTALAKNEIQLKTYIPELKRSLQVSYFGRIFSVSGRDVILFPVSVMAIAVDRDPKTIRRWEKEGKWPKPMWKVPDGRTTRWYSKDQILAIHALYQDMSRGDHGYGHSPHFPVDDFLKAVRSIFYRVDAQKAAQEK